MAWGESAGIILIEDVGGSNKLAGDFIDSLTFEALWLRRPRSFGIVCAARRRGVLGCVWIGHCCFESEELPCRKDAACKRPMPRASNLVVIVRNQV